MRAYDISWKKRYEAFMKQENGILTWSGILWQKCFCLFFTIFHCSPIDVSLDGFFLVEHSSFYDIPAAAAFSLEYSRFNKPTPLELGDCASSVSSRSIDA